MHDTRVVLYPGNKIYFIFKRGWSYYSKLKLFFIQDIIATSGMVYYKYQVFLSIIAIPEKNINHQYSILMENLQVSDIFRIRNLILLEPDRIKHRVKTAAGIRCCSLSAYL